MAKNTPKPSMSSKLNSMFISPTPIEIQKQNVEEKKETTKQIEVAATEEKINTSINDSVNNSTNTNANTIVVDENKNDNKEVNTQPDSSFVIKKSKGKEEKDYFGLYLKPENNKKLDALTGNGKKSKSITGMSKSQLIEFFIEKGLENLQLID